MAVWPIFLSRYMYEEPPVPRIAVGDTSSWDVRLVDGEAEGWPAEVLVDTRARFSSAGGPGIPSLFAHVGDLSVCWEEFWDENEPIPLERAIRAGLSADWFLPPPDSSVTGIVRQIQVVSQGFATVGSAEHRRLRPIGEWQLTDVRESPRSLGPTLGWSKEIVIRSSSDAQGRSRPRELSSSLKFEGPEPGDEPVPQVTGLLVRVDLLASPATNP